MRLVEPELLTKRSTGYIINDKFINPSMCFHHATSEYERNTLLLFYKPQIKYKYIDTDERALIVDEILNQYKIHNVYTLYINSIASIRGIDDECRKHQCSIHVINPYRESFLKNQYTDLRSEAYNRLLISIKSQEYLLPEQLSYEVSCIHYDYDAQGRIQVESYESLRKRGLAIPTLAEAFMLSFAFRRAGVW